MSTKKPAAKTAPVKAAPAPVKKARVRTNPLAKRVDAIEELLGEILKALSEETEQNVPQPSVNAPTESYTNVTVKSPSFPILTDISVRLESILDQGDKTLNDTVTAMESLSNKVQWLNAITERAENQGRTFEQLRQSIASLL